MATLKYWVTLISICLFLTITPSSEAAPTYTSTYCSNATTYSPNSTFETNLNILFYYFSGNLSQSNGFFLSITGFSTTAAVNGLFFCRGDVSAAVCQQCVDAAMKEIRQRCPNQTEALIWYDECMLRYTNKYFAANTVVPRVSLNDGVLNNSASVDLGRFNQSLNGLLNELATEARNSPTATKFAGGEVEVASSVTVYGLEQCSNDLSSSGCETCLRNAIEIISFGKQGARVLLPSCNVRYQLYPFFTLPSPPSKGGRKLGSGTIAAILVVPIVSLIILFLSGFYYLRNRPSRKKRSHGLIENHGDEITTLKSLQFDLATVQAATNHFSLGNKIGFGGFGQVYKGILPDGRQIAVKKLSKTSDQGTIEFKNEILLIAKLQHRNLVTLLGFCSEQQEMMLIYEYVSNQSLDYFLFDSHRRRVLTWPERYKIIGGIARGIHYLHDESRLKVIHRDLKPSNILLDDNMNPKISDFGMAKMIAIDQDEGITRRIAGTYGYMSPEYAMHGQFSEKSDVFSFGVIVLEIISTKRNARVFGSPELDDDLLSYAWRNWQHEYPLEILDPDLKESSLFSQNEVIKCIQLGMLCVQQNPYDRPTMERVVSYLSNVSVELPLPREPALFMGIGNNPNVHIGSSSDQQITNSDSAHLPINDITISCSLPR